MTVAVRATAEGGGEVSATVSLDREAAAQVPDLAEQLRVSDLRAAGWRIEGPAPAPGGRTEVRAVKPFGSPAEARRAMEELSGAGGPFGSLRLTRTRSFLKTRTSLAGTVDLTGGLEAFSDEFLEQRLGGSALGVDPARLEAELGKPLADAFGFRLTAELPGQVEANAAGAVWEARLGQAVPVNASAAQWNFSTIGFGAVSLLSGITLLAVLVRRRL
ncbi:MAG: hypothetical protein CYG61_00665 [Actinobacteria bacterium]|nr:MAG: hypothetical protein CYG61_00665 [Actinomycetota bacterium]